MEFVIQYLQFSRQSVIVCNKVRKQTYKSIITTIFVWKFLITE